MNESLWLQMLLQYAYNNKLEQIGEENWNDFVRDYGKWEIWKESYYNGETPEDALESEMSYWEV